MLHLFVVRYYVLQPKSDTYTDNPRWENGIVDGDGYVMYLAGVTTNRRAYGCRPESMSCGQLYDTSFYKILRRVLLSLMRPFISTIRGWCQADHDRGKWLIHLAWCIMAVSHQTLQFQLWLLRLQCLHQVNGEFVDGESWVNLAYSYCRKRAVGGKMG